MNKFSRDLEQGMEETAAYIERPKRNLGARTIECRACKSSHTLLGFALPQIRGQAIERR